MKRNNKASIFVYILLLINIICVIGVVVYNNSSIVDSNIDIGKNTEEVFSSVYDKGYIAIESLIKYNSNGNGFLDGISCPTNVTMSGTTSSGTISTQMVYNTGSIYCSGNYNGSELRIYYNEDISDFDKAYYKGYIVNISPTTNTIINLGTTNLALSSSISGSSPYIGSLSNIKDGNISTYYESYDPLFDEPDVTFNLGSGKNIGLIKIFKTDDLFSWDDGYIDFYDNSYNYLDTIYLSGIGRQDEINIDLNYYGLTNSVRYITINGPRFGELELYEVEIYELLSTGTEEIWEIDNNFVYDNTYMSFTTDGIGGNDGIDDNFNSDDYKAISGNTPYPGGYADDDVVPRKIIFGSVNPGLNDYNIFWNNYKTNDFIANNPNNTDNINVKIGDVTNGYMHLDLYNSGTTLYDLKILEFNRNSYKDEYTLLPLKTTSGSNLTNFAGYIQTNTGVLSLSKNITGKEYIFDFTNKDYAIFLSNKKEENLAYRLSAVTNTGTGIYINPIDDSGTGVIDVMANHIIIGGEKNFIGENFVVSGLK